MRILVIAAVLFLAACAPPSTTPITTTAVDATPADTGAPQQK